MNVYHAISNAFAVVTHYMLYTFDPATAELADANNTLQAASNVIANKTEAVLTAVYNSDKPDIKVNEATAANDELCAASDALTVKTEVMHMAVDNFEEPEFKVENTITANKELCLASDVLTEKTEVTHTAVYNYDEPGIKIEKATATNNKLCTANNVIAEKTNAMVTADNSAKEHEFKVKKATEAQKHDVNLRKVAPPLASKRQPLTRIKSGMYGNTNDEFQRYNNAAGYYNEFAYNLDDELKRCGELVPNYYEFAVF
ncbi:hypothetical protein LPJ77_004662 [Coemansia sp. RSA 2523]|nr:hypothetical protein LPJ58_003395 [Coemansia sp. RSA 1591]KAJ1760593.1 hypothetical protein LPJ69_003366 [Coemansia sp. RSA 1752]KAJ1774227.1 hypothetical protein LPJ54_004411 [Coemansia sp. RSA 1824]KAJ1787210.1 hypothetical protein LPJ67_003282 [Coemansia sp. RSA 1938]KAJ1792809.1 hypothetical protein LPJ62_000610 [Coemansia sp. RSA 2167]KAJ1804637.1 hypothetical protein LPJ77_004662 [Coemansia sp. RSA 2523]KAJ2136277.1 hypothetical protein GGH17_002025 [Coemansia sp. RSA 788]KAJ2141237